MKWFAFAGTFFTAAVFIAFSFKPQPAKFETPAKSNIISCTPDREKVYKRLADADIPPMPGAGNYQWKISVTHDSAQFYFNQGINMYYGFHIIESMASFKKALRFDPQSAMLWWAQALAFGPNINDVGYNSSPMAYEAVQKALSLSAAASPVEKMLIHAMSVRYSNDSTLTREKLNQQYADEMKKVHGNFAFNADVAVLYADALMLQHPWDLWNNDGTPKHWTPRIRSLLEKLLVHHPQHPGANHYYIHVMEASPFASLALPNAERLGKLTPGLSHMVHMPSHIYLRLGQFNKGSRVNEEAVSTFRRYSFLFPAVNDNAFLYQWHNLHMQANCGLMASRYQYSLTTANDLQALIDTSLLSLPAPMGAYIQYLYMTPALINVHFGKWKNLLQIQEPAPHHVYAVVLYHFAKGMAYAAQNMLTEAENEKKELEIAMKDETLLIPMHPFSPAIEGAKCADYLLTGFIHLKNKNDDEAEINFKKAVETEGKMVYNEPRDWLLNSRQYLGNFYLKKSRWKEAEKTFLADMQVNKNNVWSLYGLITALEKQGRKEQAKAFSELFKNAKEHSDHKKNVLLF